MAEWGKEDKEARRSRAKVISLITFLEDCDLPYFNGLTSTSTALDLVYPAIIKYLIVGCTYFGGFLSSSAPGRLRRFG